MRIVVLSPQFKPHPGGVSDYSFELCQQFHELGHEVVVVTSTQGEFLPGPFKILTVPNWGILQAFRLRRVLRELRGDQHFFQWTPLAFGPHTWGMAPGLLTLFALTLKTPKVLMAHESHYPVLLDLRGLLIGLPHFIQFWLMGLFVMISGGKIVFSHKANERDWKKRYPLLSFKNKISTQGVFSNIPFIPQKDEAKKADDDSIRLCYFGGRHPTNDLALLREAFDYCQKNAEKPVTLSLIGISPENCPAILKGEGISALGHLSEKDVSFTLQQSNVLVIPFVDGVSTRRGTLMAGLLHGTPVVTTAGWNTLDDVPWNKIVALVPSHERQAFCHLTYELTQNPEKAHMLAKVGQRYYEENFCSRHGANVLLDLPKGP